MRVLVVKLTSMGDVLHLMPAINDLCSKESDVVIDWMVEDSFAEIPSWHPNVDRVITVATRRWRRLAWSNIGEFFRFVTELRSARYDVVIDAQGLIKSALFSRMAKRNKGGYHAGYSDDSIKESPAAWFYRKKISIAREQHAIQRLRELFATCFDYTFDSKNLNYGLEIEQKVEHVDERSATSNKPSILLFHGTTWPSKHLPDPICCLLYTSPSPRDS